MIQRQRTAIEWLDPRSSLISAFGALRKVAGLGVHSGAERLIAVLNLRPIQPLLYVSSPLLAVTLDL